MTETNDTSAISLEYISARVLEKLGAPKSVGQPTSSVKIHPSIDHRVDPEDLRLPGLVSEPEWGFAEQLTKQTETSVFGGKLSPLNQALLFRIIYVELLQMQLKPN